MEKTIITIFVISLIGFNSVDAQLIRSYGLKIGSTSADQSWNWPEQSGIITKSTPRQGADIGFFIEWFDIPMISALTEVHYIQKGSMVNTNIMITTAQNPDGYGQFLSYTIRINYLSLPLLLKLRMNFGVLSTYILAGPRFDYCLSSSSTSISVDFNKLDTGGTFGVGLDLASVLPIHLGAELRYSPTFDDSYSKESLRIRNSSIEFLLVLNF